MREEDLGVKLQKESEKKAVSFYKDFFTDEIELAAFLEKVYQMDWDNRVPRQMINQIIRFVTLSQRIEEIYPPRDGLRLLFLKMCMESLNFLGGKCRDFYNKFSECFSNEAVRYILGNFKFIGYSINGKSIDEYFHDDFTIAKVLEVIKVVRNQVVHDGNFWDFQMFVDDTDYQLLTSLKTQDTIFDLVKRNSKKDIVEYDFETMLSFDRFIYFFTEACITYVDRYIDERMSIDYTKASKKGEEIS